MRLLELAWCSTSLEFFLSLILVSLTNFHERFNFLSLTLRDSSCFVRFTFSFEICAGKIGVRQARIDCLAHAWHLDRCVPFGKVSTLSADQPSHKPELQNPTLQESAFTLVSIHQCWICFAFRDYLQQIHFTRLYFLYLLMNLIKAANASW